VRELGLSAGIHTLLEQHNRGEKFSVSVVKVSASDAREWVRFKSDPIRFVPSIFVGDWAVPDRHPAPGEFRILRIVTGADGVARAITRQGRHLYAYPWLK